MSTVGQIAIPTGFQKFIESPFDCSFDEIRFLEDEIEKARKQVEMNAGKAVQGCKCQRCQDIRYFAPFLAEIPLKPWVPSLQLRAGA
jgi:hypothetical protein